MSGYFQYTSTIFWLTNTNYYGLGFDPLKINLLPFKISDIGLLTISKYLKLYLTKENTENIENKINIVFNSKNRKQVIQCLQQLYSALNKLYSKNKSKNKINIQI